MFPIDILRWWLRWDHVVQNRSEEPHCTENKPDSRYFVVGRVSDPLSRARFAGWATFVSGLGPAFIDLKDLTDRGLWVGTFLLEWASLLLLCLQYNAFEEKGKGMRRGGRLEKSKCFEQVLLMRTYADRQWIQPIREKRVSLKDYQLCACEGLFKSISFYCRASINNLCNDSNHMKVIQP